MKKKISISLLILTLLISCNKKTEKNEIKGSENEMSEVAKSCNCDELDINKDSETIFLTLIHNLKTKELYTGTCISKDQNDSITRKMEIKNGYLVHDIKKEKILNEYVVTQNMTYENKWYKDGFKLETLIYTDRNNKDNYYTRKYEEYKIGKIFNDWESSIFFSRDDDDDYELRICLKTIKGKNVQYKTLDNEDIPSCIKEANIQENLFIFDNQNSTFDKVTNTIDCLAKSDNLRGFKVWK